VDEDGDQQTGGGHQLPDYSVQTTTARAHAEIAFGEIDSGNSQSIQINFGVIDSCD
jgi:hypothetical protein